ncbi:MAG: hypothetical protein JWO57_2644, partial [Pseudonocardiales bacterium]|nr:hypothetical protein [Pseudonocardiales bacterium]
MPASPVPPIPVPGSSPSAPGSPDSSLHRTPSALDRLRERLVARWDPGAKGAAAIAAAVLVVAVVTVAWVLASRPHAIAVAAHGPSP